MRRRLLPLLGCAVLAACPAPAWQVVFDGKDQDRAVLSVWGAGASDVYAVGGALGNGQPTLALRFDGRAWHDLAPGGTGTLWWVAGSGPTDVWMVGTEGRLLHWDGATFVEHVSVTAATLWGVWATSPTDAWAVGGTPGGGRSPSADNDLVLHWDGAAWTREVLPRTLGVALFKVWGIGDGELYAVGEGGVIWHRSGGAWRLESEPPVASGTLLTVAGCGPNEVYAVGGQDVLRSDGTHWTREAVTLSGTVDGVSCGTGGVVLVGTGGVKLRREGGAWVDDSSHEPYAELHGAWADESGAFWAVGGDFFTGPLPMRSRHGVVARYGSGTVSNRFAP